MRKDRKIKFFILLILLDFFVSKATAQTNSLDGVEIEQWDRYIRKFRRDHHLSLITSYDRGSWDVRHFGPVDDQSFVSTGIETTLEYTFHIQIIGRFGYSLGTSAGYMFERAGSKDERFTPASAWKLPGLVGQLVYNIDPAARIFVGGAAYLARFNGFRVVQDDGSDDRAALTAEAFSFQTGIDLFYTINSGVRFFYNRQLMMINRLDDSNYLSNAHLIRNSQGGGIGAVYHFL